MKILSITGLLVATTTFCPAALVLNGGSYLEDFDDIGGGLPSDWTVRTGAGASTLGSSVAFTTTATSWGESGGAFKNLASADGLLSTATVAQQAASLDRALGVRQTGTFGDSGAAFVLEIANTAGFQGFELNFKAEMLSVQPRSTTWVIDYRFGDSGDFTVLGSYNDPNVFGSTLISFNAAELSAWNNQSTNLWLRIVALGSSSGSGNRDTFAIDDFSLTFAAVPEPSTFVAGALLALPFGVHGVRYLRNRKRA